jgi:hypothetical protein
MNHVSYDRKDRNDGAYKRKYRKIFMTAVFSFHTGMAVMQTATIELAVNSF